jgi:hypothetical protein
MTDWLEKEVPIAEIKTLLDNGYDVEVDSPDGWVGVNHFINKGIWDEYVLKIDGFDNISCNENHLFETAIGWMSAIELCDRGMINFITKDGFKRGIVTRTNERIPIVDINVNHENHRYYTAGVSSHNTGVGKSLFMCHMAAACLVKGKNVLYVTLELAEEEVGKRIDANLMNVAFDDLMAMSKQMYDKKAATLKAKTNGKLIIKEYPTASASTIHFKALLNELNLKKSFKPDIIFIDYLNICMSSRVKPGGSVNSYTYIKSIAEELRGLAVEYEVPLVSATQTTRSGFSNSDVDLTDTSESFGLPATADFMFALINTEQLQSLNQVMVKQLKNRYSDLSLNTRFVIGVDRSKMKLYDTEQSSQVDISESGQDTPVMDNSNSMTRDKFKRLKVT